MADRPRPKPGELRLYHGVGEMILYPGEQATAMLSPAILQALAAGETVEVREFLVEPAPGWHARYLRWRYRLFRWRSRRG